LGCAQVICTDKTGTLTQNAMTARRLWVDGASFSVEGDPRKLDGGITPTGEKSHHEADLRLALESAAHASGAHLTLINDGRIEIQGDPTDAALQVLARRLEVEAPGKVLGEQPFSSQRRMASLMAHVGGHVRVYVRGAPEALLER